MAIGKAWSKKGKKVGGGGEGYVKTTGSGIASVTAKGSALAKDKKGRTVGAGGGIKISSKGNA
jgi:hypothetical protein